MGGGGSGLPSLSRGGPFKGSPSGPSLGRRDFPSGARPKGIAVVGGGGGLGKREKSLELRGNPCWWGRGDGAFPP